MPVVGDIARRVRSKNAGPFWLTIDLFCGDDAGFERLRAGLDTAAVARAFQVEEAVLRRFDIADLKVIKISLPRPVVQGARADRDMHGAGFAEIIRRLPLADAQARP